MSISSVGTSPNDERPRVSDPLVPVNQSGSSSEITKENKLSKLSKRCALSLSSFLFRRTDFWKSALLPATQHQPIPTTNSFKIRNPREEDCELEAMLLKPNIASNNEKPLPLVVLFCPNDSLMQFPNMLDRAKEYKNLGFNVVLFNYRGVGGSSGSCERAEDLVEDGNLVVNAVLNGTIPGLKSVGAENIVLDGTSIGGSVALAVGRNNFDMTVAVNHTFTNWNKAAGSVVSNRTNKIIGKMAEFYLKHFSNRAKVLDNTNALEIRNLNKAVTIVQTAGKDEMLNEDSRLKALEGQEEIFEQAAHKEFIPLSDRKLLTRHLQAMMNPRVPELAVNANEKARELNLRSLAPEVGIIESCLAEVMEPIHVLKFALNPGQTVNLDEVKHCLQILKKAVEQLETQDTQTIIEAKRKAAKRLGMNSADTVTPKMLLAKIAESERVIEELHEMVV